MRCAGNVGKVRDGEEGKREGETHGIERTRVAVPPSTLLRACRIPLSTPRVLLWVTPRRGARGGYSQLGQLHCESEKCVAEGEAETRE